MQRLLQLVYSRARDRVALKCHCRGASKAVAHDALFGEFLPLSMLTQSRIHHTIRLAASYTGRFSPFDYWEAEYSCASESRVPGRVVGDGVKWLCAAALHPAPCQVVSLCSHFDDAFERGMHKLASCKSYVVDPTLQSNTKKLHAFERQLKSYGASLNNSVGVGRASKVLRFNGLKAPLVSLETNTCEIASLGHRQLTISAQSGH